MHLLIGFIIALCLLGPLISAAILKRLALVLGGLILALAAFASTLLTSQWKSTRTSNAIERLHEEFKRRIKKQTILPSSDTAAMLFWALMASGQILMRKVHGWTSLATPIAEHQPVALAA